MLWLAWKAAMAAKAKLSASRAASNKKTDERLRDDARAAQHDDDAASQLAIGSNTQMAAEGKDGP